MPGGTFDFSKDKLIRFIQRRLHIENQNMNIIICGGNGSGKSYASLYMASRIDPTFNISRVVFSPIELFELLQKKLPKGACIIIEEAGVNADSRKFQESINKALAYLQQTIRMKNYCFIYNVPSMDWIDNRVRSLLHLYIEMRGINIATQCGIGKINILQPNYRMGKTYYHTPSFTKNEKPFLMTSIFFPKPPHYLISPYEEKKAAFVDDIIDNGLKIAQRAAAKTSNTEQPKKSKRGRPRKKFKEVSIDT